MPNVDGLDRLHEKTLNSCCVHNQSCHRSWQLSTCHTHVRRSRHHAPNVTHLSTNHAQVQLNIDRLRHSAKVDSLINLLHSRASRLRTLTPWRFFLFIVFLWQRIFKYGPPAWPALSVNLGLIMGGIVCYCGTKPPQAVLFSFASTQPILGQRCGIRDCMRSHKTAASATRTAGMDLLHPISQSYMNTWERCV